MLPGAAADALIIMPSATVVNVTSDADAVSKLIDGTIMAFFKNDIETRLSVMCKNDVK